MLFIKETSEMHLNDNDDMKTDMFKCLAGYDMTESNISLNCRGGIMDLQMNKTFT